MGVVLDPPKLGQIKTSNPNETNFWRKVELPLPGIMTAGQRRLLIIGNVIVFKLSNGNPELEIDYTYQENEKDKLIVAKLGGLSTVQALSEPYNLFEFKTGDFDLGAWNQVSQLLQGQSYVSAEDFLSLPDQANLAA